MASRYERAASLVQASIDQYGENADWEVLIGLMRDCHIAERDGWSIEQLLDAQASRIENIYIPAGVSFESPQAPPA